MARGPLRGAGACASTDNTLWRTGVVARWLTGGISAWPGNRLWQRRRARPSRRAVSDSSPVCVRACPCVLRTESSKTKITTRTVSAAFSSSVMSAVFLRSIKDRLSRANTRDAASLLACCRKDDLVPRKGEGRSTSNNKRRGYHHIVQHALLSSSRGNTPQPASLLFDRMTRH